mgnify:CR=1 FL=1
MANRKIYNKQEKRPYGDAFSLYHYLLLITVE